MIDELLKFNREFVKSKGYERFITNKYPDKKIAIVSCMDTRLTELLPAALGIKNGDVKIIKNAGAIISHPFGSVIRSLLVAIYELGVNEVMIVGHTDCGAKHMDSEQMIEVMKKRGIPSEHIDMMRYCGIKLVDVKNDALFQGTNGILTMSFIIILILCSTGFLIYWILSIRQRELLFGVFRAMGMTKKEIIQMLINEQIFSSGISILIGAGLGVLSSILFVPLVQIFYASTDQTVPLAVVFKAFDMIRLFSVIGIVIVICMVVLGKLISKINISQALKLGED